MFSTFLAECQASLSEEGGGGGGGGAELDSPAVDVNPWIKQGPLAQWSAFIFSPFFSPL